MSGGYTVYGLVRRVFKFLRLEATATAAATAAARARATATVTTAAGLVFAQGSILGRVADKAGRHEACN